MSTEAADAWPDRGARYERPLDTPFNQARWQSALDDSLAAESITLTPTNDPDIAVLIGACPRCDHTTQQEVEFGVIGDLGPKRRRTLWFNWDCACGKTHQVDGEKHSSCGWGGPLAVQIKRPVKDHG